MRRSPTQNHPSSSPASSPAAGGSQRRRQFQSQQQSQDGNDDDEEEVTGSNFKVVIRVRPPLPRELEGDKPFQNVVKVSRDERAITISENVNATDEDGNPTYGNGPYSTHRFTFDTVYGQNSTQEKVYNTTARAVVDSSLQGYNATIFAYGQTGTGKTYTMEGFHQHDQRGIIPRAIEQIFNHISSSVSPRLRFLVRASYLQIYNEVISDLLKPERTNLAIREAKKRGVFVEGLSEWVVRSPEEIYGLMERGGAMRATGSTKMNELSSRSHAVFIIIVEQSETTYVDSSGNELLPEDFHELVKMTTTQNDLNSLEKDVRQSFKVGKLNLVDLAGSERVRLSGATGQRLEESKKINQSLSALGNVIAALTDVRGRQHIPYRDSKLTRILEDSLGGNCKTTMMAMVSPALEAILESVSTLKFANRAKNIKNLATINEDMDQRSLLRKYERELKRLRAELENRTKTVVDKRRLLELDEQRRRAEQDKMAAIRALEKRSLEFMREKQEKKRLESKINSLQGQMLMGGLEKNIVATPAFRAALKEQRDTIRKEYEKRLGDLEDEREQIEEEKAQVDRYKQLLLKQRDIMIALTQRLNERDEQIMALQDELDAYDRHQKELEEKLDEKTAALIHLQRVTMEHNANSPIKNADLDEALGGWAPPGQNGVKSGGGGSGGGGGGGGGSGGSNAAGGGPLSSPGGTGKEGRRKAAEARRAAAGKTRSSSSSGGGVSGGDRAGARGVITQQQQQQQQQQQKQYEPHNDATVFVGNGGETAQLGEERRMLSADEKIQELTLIVDKQKGDQHKLSRELEEVQAEKVSMEYLLREKLEKLVQSEIEARLYMYRRDDRESALLQRPMASLKTELEKSKEDLRLVSDERKQAGEEVRMLREKLQKLSSQSIAANVVNGPPSTPRGTELKSRLDTLSRQHESFRQEMASRMENKNRAMQQMQKERRAIQTIMERKIKTLTDNIAGALAAITKMSGNGNGSGSLTDNSAAHTQRLSREVLALQRLVNAAITALRNAETESA